jgi:flagellar M-ring protein FliF
MSMPPQIQALLQNQRMMMLVGGGLVAIIVVSLLVMQPWAPKQEDIGAKVLSEEQLKLTTVDSMGKAIEIQALLAREGLRMDLKDGDGGKVEVKFDKQATLNERDRAIIALVQSGLMDRNIGLESFDKGDLTASREEKRIKLVRAQQGEISRLIRKIKPIQDASVSLSIPEPTIFKSEMKPMSASVQVTIPNGDRLDRDKVRSIINLMVGSIQGLDAQHVALSDTNGNTYNSVLDVGSEMHDKLEEQDQYMKQKVSAQLDKLVGAGHYVVTVSTLMRQTSKETMVQSYDPEQSAVTSKQSFVEKLNANGGKNGIATGGPTSAMLPRGMESTSVTQQGGGNQRGYTRNGVEVSYANGKTQYVETSLPGMIEDISVAVTIDKNNMPSMSMEALQQLVARSASPKVDPNTVTIALTDFEKPAAFGLSTSKNGVSTGSGSKTGGSDENNSGFEALFGGENGEQDYSWVLWPVASVVVVFLLLTFMSLFKSTPKSPIDPQAWQQNQMELQQLKEFTTQQMSALQASQQQTQMILEQQRQMLNNPQPTVVMQGGQQPAQIPVATGINTSGINTANTDNDDLRQTLAELKETVQQKVQEDDDEDLDLQIKSWIESS